MEVIKKSPQQQNLLDAAMTIKESAYSPYSKFRVGAAILGDNQHVYVGCNVENASYPLGQCAEGSAITAMVAAGCHQIKEVMVITDKDEYCAPCGGCRQKLYEFADESTLVHMATVKGEVKTVKLVDLLPLAFGKRDLG